MKVPVRCLVICAKQCFLNYKFLAVVTCTLVILILVELSKLGGEIAQLDPLRNATRSKTTTPGTPVYLNPERLKQILVNKKNNNLMAKKNKTEMKLKWLKEKIEKLSRMRPKPQPRHVEVNETVGINYNVHIFYYAWYENEEVDGNWQHWNHKYLKNWKVDDKRQYPTGSHVPPDDIGSNYYPKLGCYSSRDRAVLYTHMRQMRDAGIGVLIVSWYPPGMSDGSPNSPDSVFLRLLDAANIFHLKVAPHIEPYDNRNPKTFLKYLKYFKDAYEDHPALYKMKKGNRELIVYYIYDSYRTPAYEWKELLSTNGNISVRGSPLDGIFLGLLVDFEHKNEIIKARFDGFYTYFASNGFCYGSSWKNWLSLAMFARKQKLIFVPSVGPGYIDTRIRPWNSANTRHRRQGKYYEVGWRTAIFARATHVSITSFNEWHEGTQIEPAVPKSTKNFTYLDYEPEGSDFYLNLTKFWINEFSKKKTNGNNIYVPIL